MLGTKGVVAYHRLRDREPSSKAIDLGTMCTEHWRAYVKGLREARKAAKVAGGPEADAA